MALTFVFVRVVLELPLAHQDVEVARLLEEAQIPHGDVGGEHPLKLPAPRILVLCFHENADVIWGQDVQDRRIKILQTRAARGQGEVNYVLPVPFPTSLLHEPFQAEVNMCLCSSLSKPDLFLISSPAEITPRGEQSEKGHRIDTWDRLEKWLGSTLAVQVAEEVVSYLVRYLLCQVIGLLHLLCCEMLRGWPGLLLQSAAQTEDTKKKKSGRTFKQTKPSTAVAGLLPATLV